MDQIEIYSDQRLDELCAYCGGLSESRDHVPSKVLLDEPYPENLPIVPSCLKCNQSFSLDEEYFACLLECVLHGTTNPDLLERIKIKRILSENSNLRLRLENASSKTNGDIFFEPEEPRIKNVILKLAKGHVKYENSEQELGDPLSFLVKPVAMLSLAEVDTLFQNKQSQLWPEIASRGLTRSVRDPDLEWIVVQPNVYRYKVSIISTELIVRIIIHEYLACVVKWR